ncbi:hypothetical protein INR49_005190, partial [Caranx melampygus]
MRFGPLTPLKPTGGVPQGQVKAPPPISLRFHSIRREDWHHCHGSRGPRGMSTCCLDVRKHCLNRKNKGNRYGTGIFLFRLFLRLEGCLAQAGRTAALSQGCHRRAGEPPSHPPPALLRFRPHLN